MPVLGAVGFPDLVIVTMDVVDGTLGAVAYPSQPPNFNSDSDKIIVVHNAGGNVNADGDTLNAIVQVQCYAPTYTDASDLAKAVGVKIETCPMTEIGPDKVLVDT